MNAPRRALILGGLAAPVALAARANAQPAWPSRPVRLIVPYAAGGPSDVLARAIQSPLQAALGQSIVIENRPGGGAIIGTEAAARAEDGHTFLVADSPHTIIPAVQARVPYDPARDFRPVTLFGAVSMILLVKPGLAARDLPAFIAAAKAQPDGITFGSSGVGSLTHLVPEWLGQLTGARFTVVPYRGSGPALMDVVAGQIDAIISSTLSASGPLKDGQVRPLAVAAPARIAALPDLPTMREGGVDMVCSNWWGLLAPRATSDAVLARMEAALATALEDATVKDRFAALGIEARPRGPAPFAALLETEFANWARVARAAGVSVP
jgi:tripartite-type tricarboxylate transporter receptor subunit TctC